MGAILPHPLCDRWSALILLDRQTFAPINHHFHNKHADDLPLEPHSRDRKYEQCRQINLSPEHMVAEGHCSGLCTT